MSKRLWLYACICLTTIAAVLGFALWHHHKSNVAAYKQTLRTHVKQVGVPPTPTTPKTTPTKTATKTPGGTGSQQSNSTDTNGQSVANTDKSKWVTSQSGNITLEQPIAGDTLKSGSVLSGTATGSGPVNYRLSDDAVGVVTQGTLNVVDSKFSGKLNFTPTASTGRLDVFSTSNRGLELDEIQIGVKF